MWPISFAQLGEMGPISSEIRTVGASMLPDRAPIQATKEQFERQLSVTGVQPVSPLAGCGDRSDTKEGKE